MVMDEYILKNLKQATNKKMFEWDKNPDSMHLGRSRSEWEVYWDNTMSVCNWFVVGYSWCPSGCCKTPQLHPDARCRGG